MQLEKALQFIFRSETEAKNFRLRRFWDKYPKIHLIVQIALQLTFDKCTTILKAAWITKCIKRWERNLEY